MGFLYLYRVFFALSVYNREEKIRKKLLDYLDGLSFIKLISISILIIAVLTALSTLIHVVSYAAVLTTIFLASYLCFRYRQYIEKGTKQL